MIERAPFRFSGRGVFIGLDWPAALSIASALGLEGRDAVELLGAADAGLRAGARDLMEGDDGENP